jgi:hypothetical protein
MCSREQRQNLRKQHPQQSQQRQQEDKQWRLHRNTLREQMTLVPIVTDWIAVLVVTDNCTRQCLGLPLFVAGAHVTSDMVALALQTLLPADLRRRSCHFAVPDF